MEKVQVRQAQRVGVDIIASAQNNNPDKSFTEPQGVVLKDLSTGGAMFESEIRIGDIKDRLTITSRVDIDGIGEQYLSLDAIIRSLHKRDQNSDSDARHLHGVEFMEINQETALILHGYVYQQIAKSRR